MDLGLTDRVFVVTAASSGLGFASAQALVDEGARVLLVARRDDALAAACAELGEAARFVSGDLSDPSLPERATTAAVEAFGQVDGAIVSVGGPPKGGVLDNTDEQWRTAFDGVFLPAVRMARAVCARTAAPRLAFVLSSSVKVPLPTMAISNGLRPGLAALIKQLADEMGPTGGRAVGLMPGTVMTERITNLYGDGPDAQAAMAATAASIPLRRLGDPAEFGKVAAFAVSDAASYITGSMLAIDGGALRSL